MGIGGEKQIGFTFKVFVRPYISQIRMFAIKILVLRVLLETFCAPPYFLGAKKLKPMLFIVIVEFLPMFL